MIDAPALVRYCAYAAVDGGGPAHEVTAASFAEAAMQFVEVWHPAADGAGQVRIIVTDQACGEQQCFVVDLVEAQAEPC